MAKKKSSKRPRKRTRVKNLPAGKAEKVQGGLLLSTQQLQAPRSWTEGNTQPPRDLRK